MLLPQPVRLHDAFMSGTELRTLVDPLPRPTPPALSKPLLSSLDSFPSSQLRKQQINENHIPLKMAVLTCPLCLRKALPHARSLPSPHVKAFC